MRAGPVGWPPRPSSAVLRTGAFSEKLPEPGVLAQRAYALDTEAGATATYPRPMASGNVATAVQKGRRQGPETPPSAPPRVQSSLDAASVFCSQASMPAFPGTAQRQLPHEPNPDSFEAFEGVHLATAAKRQIIRSVVCRGGNQTIFPTQYLHSIANTGTFTETVK